MAWSIRSLDDASAAIRGSFRRWLPGSDTALKNNFVTVVAKVLAGISHEFELRMGYLARQMFLTSATGKFLELHCSDVGIFRKPASAAAGIASGTAAVSTAYPAGIRFVSGNVTYVSTAAANSGADGSLVLSIKAETKGSHTNRDGGGLLSLADPGLYPDLSTMFEVNADGLGGGADIETNDSLKARGLQRKRNPPGAGTLSDYEREVRAVSGVKQAWAFRGQNPGDVFVYFLFEGRPGYIPEPSDVTVVQAAIDAKRLIRSDASEAVAPTAHSVDVTISGLSPDNEEIRAAIEAAIADIYLTKCRPGIAGNTFTLSRSWIGEAISGVTGEESHVLVAPAADIVLTGGQFPTPGTYSYPG